MPSFEEAKKTAHLYRRKLALKIKESMENDYSTDDDTQIAVEKLTFGANEPEASKRNK